MVSKDGLELKKHLEDSAKRFEELSKRDGMEEKYITFCIEQADRQRRELARFFPPKESKNVKI